MASKALSKSTSAGVTISVILTARNEAAAKRLLSQPAFRSLVDALKELGAEGPAGPTRTKPFKHYTLRDFKENAQLRTNAINWLLAQALLPPGDPAKEVRCSITIPANLDHYVVREELPQLHNYFKEQAKAKLGKNASYEKIAGATKRAITEFIRITIGTAA